MRDLVDELLQAQVKAKLFGRDPQVELGRWRLVEKLGSGAMGVVFAAYDPRLEREVAIKVLTHPDAGDRVLGEARALARLSHPNVVAVHDAGELDGLVYLVMERVPGSSLRTWAPGRPWREVMRAARDAAQGLAAAHAAGLVHRDIKPDNILVGADRARVVDFGLAQTGDDGAAAGTPLYMAPEIRAGQAATAASDQYSFGVTMFEALYGTRPTPSAKAPASAVPTWVHHVVVRMLAPAPDNRFASMREVVRALKRDHRRVRFGALLACTAVVGGALGAWTMHHPAAGDACADAPAHRAVVWNGSMRAGVKAGLAGAPWTARTLEAFDQASLDWERGYRAVCEATRVHGDQSDALLELRMRCLDRALDRLGALATALAGNREARALPDSPSGPTGNPLDAAARAAAPAAVAALPRAAACETLTDPAELALPSDPVQRERARSTERELDRGWAAVALGRYRDAQQIASHAAAQLAQLDAPAVRAGALVLGAAVASRIGTPPEAHARLQAALDAAAAAHSGALELEVWARMLRGELFAGDPKHVIEWAPFARAAAARAGRQGAEIDGIVAEAERDAGHLAAARDLLARALSSTDPLRADQRAVLELNLGSVQLAAGESPAARVTLTRGRDRVIEALGDRHPDLAMYDDKLAAARRARGELRAARALHDQSEQLRTEAFGAGDRSVATSLFHRAQTELEAGEVAVAEHALHEAIAIRTKVYGEASPRLGELDAALGDCDLARGDLEGARDHDERAARLDSRLDSHVDSRVGPDTSGALATVPALAPDELLSLDRATALAAQAELLARTGDTTGAAAIGTALHARYRPDLDPALAIAIARAWFAGGKHHEAADLFAAALARDGTEPSRTALAAAIGLARCDDPRAGQAARTAISLYQAMPQLGRADYANMLELASHP